MPILRNKSFDTDESIFIFSEPRGGSTWMMELINNIPNTAAIFEPFHSHYGALDVYTWGKHLNKDDEWKEGKAGIDEIINANKFDSYQLERTPFLQLINAKQLIFKCVMGTSILPWIVEQYNLKYKPIFIIRHPLSVAASTLQNLYKRGHTINVDHRWIPTGYNLDLYEKNKDLFSEDSPMIDQLIARWCINNHYTFRQPNDRWIQMNYEHLLLNPKETLCEIFEEWSISPPEGIWDKIDKPSHSDFRNDFRKNKEEQIGKWLKQYSNNELNHFQKILDRFDIDMYTMDDPMPKTSGPICKAEFRSNHE